MLKASSSTTPRALACERLTDVDTRNTNVLPTLLFEQIRLEFFLNSLSKEHETLSIFDYLLLVLVI
jgi:hypothetical protein